MFTCCLRERKHGCMTAHAIGPLQIRTVYYFTYLGQPFSQCYPRTVYATTILPRLTPHCCCCRRVFPECIYCFRGAMTVPIASMRKQPSQHWCLHLDSSSVRHNVDILCQYGQGRPQFSAPPIRTVSRQDHSLFCLLRYSLLSKANGGRPVSQCSVVFLGAFPECI